MANCIAIAQQKGGVGKTTTTINLGAALAEAGRKVLLIDLDPQGALTAGLGINPDSIEATMYEVLRERKRTLQSIIIRTESGCDLAPANIDLAASELELVSETGREKVLAEKLAAIQSAYDFVLIDCPPSLGLLTINALTAASRVIVPVQCQFFALRGLTLLFDTIGKVQGRINPELKVSGILPTIFDARTTHAREVLEELQSTYGKQVFKTAIPQTIKFADSSLAGQSVLSTNSVSPAADAYRALAKEVLKRG